jgi:protocatechuate 3,4-dioxygenase beta subunit
MRKSSLAVALICAAPAIAQNQPPTPATVSGVVTNSVTGAPIPRVHVILHPDDQRHFYGALSDAEGKFSMASVPPGQYSVEMQRTGFLMERHYGFGDDTSSLQLTTGQKKDVSLTLIPAGSITGHVLDAAGEPMESITVTAEGGWIGGVNSVTTDDTGNFRLSGLSPGKYRVRAAPMNLPFPPEHRTDGTQEVHHASTYFAASLTVKAASRVTVNAGAETTAVDIRLVRTPIVRVSGKLIGFPAGEHSVNLQLERDGNSNISGFNKPDGTFEIWRLDPGKYRLYAAAGQAQLRSAPVEFEIAGANIDNLVLRAIPAADIPGHVTFEDDSARPKDGGRLVLTELTSSPSGNVRLEDAPIDSDGSFVFKKVQAGRYVVTTTWNTAYVKSMTLGTVPSDAGVLDLTAGAANASLSVLLSGGVAEISGTVSDDKGPADALVVFMPEANTGTPSQTGTGLKGSYTFSGIAPGEYRLVALPPGGNTRDLEAYEDGVEHITVQPGDKLVKNLKLNR